MEILFAAVRLLQLRWQVEVSSTQDLLAYLDRILNRLGLTDGSPFAHELLDSTRRQLKTLVHRLGSQTNRSGLYVVDRGVIDIFCFLRERMSTHVPSHLRPQESSPALSAILSGGALSPFPVR